MAKVKLEIKYKGDDEYKKIITHVNPNATNENLLDFVNRLNSLTTNKIDEVLRVVEKYLQDSDDDYISLETLKEILDGKYIPIADDDPISDKTFHDILDGTYIEAD